MEKEFEGQKEGERVIAIWRQHPLVMLKSTLIGILLILIGSIPIAFWSPSWQYNFLLLFIGVAGIYLVVNVYIWLNTIFILTDERIFSIYQKSILSRSTNEVPIKNIQNASHSKKGLFQMMFDYGAVEIQTAGAGVSMRIENISKPYQVQQIILEPKEG